MSLIYSICYYYGKNNILNLLRHLDIFSKINQENDIFILNVMIDSHCENFHNDIKFTLSKIIKDNNNNINYIILTNFNWGGTILALWMTTEYCIENNTDDSTYIALFEEDFIPINNNWYNDSKLLLSKDKYIYIGEHIRSKSPECKNINNRKIVINDNRINNNKCFKNIYNEYNMEINDSVYTDGGFYFSSMLNLKQIKKKIGIFHKGNCKTKWDHVIDGIIIGEVGFPSLVNKYFNFIGLDREKYFIHNN